LPSKNGSSHGHNPAYVFFCLGYRFFFSVEGGPVAVELGGVLGALGLQVRVLPRQPLDFVLRRTSNHSQHTITGNIQ